jgi:hypothetical protein
MMSGIDDASLWDSAKPRDWSVSVPATEPVFTDPPGASKSR